MRLSRLMRLHSWQKELSSSMGTWLLDPASVDIPAARQRRIRHGGQDVGPPRTWRQLLARGQSSARLGLRRLKNSQQGRQDVAPLRVLVAPVSPHTVQLRGAEVDWSTVGGSEEAMLLRKGF